MADAIMRSNNTVIEFGARFGTTSCTLANKLKNSTNLVVVAPDASAQKHLLSNRDRNKITIFSGLTDRVSDTPLKMGVNTGMPGDAAGTSAISMNVHVHGHAHACLITR